MLDDIRDEPFEAEEQQEDEEDLSIEPADFDDLIVAPSDWTLGSLYHQIGEQIDLDPAFQRRGVWNRSAKSSFIESLFLNVPIPQILLATHPSRRSQFIVLDGKQRLLTLKQFMDGKLEDGKVFKLSGLRILTELNGKSWPNISRDMFWRDRFMNVTQRTTVLKGWKSEPALYEIFYRLNSGSVKLSPMELRMSLHPGPFLKFLIAWTEEPREIRKLLRLSKPDRRMADVELAARYLAFKDDEVAYKGNLKQFIDGICATYNTEFAKDDGKAKVEVALSELEAASEAVVTIFGADHACRKWKGGRYDRLFNRAVFDVIVGSLSVPDLRKWALANPKRFEDEYIQLCKEDPAFINAVETTTKSVTSTGYRFSTWYKVISAASGVSLRVPRIAT